MSKNNEVEPKFKVGDKVRVTNITDNEEYVMKTINWVGTIIEDDEIPPRYKVEFSKEIEESGSNETFYYPEEIELARIPNTKLGRKLYPHYEVKGEWLYVKEDNKLDS